MAIQCHGLAARRLPSGIYSCFGRLNTTSRGHNWSRGFAFIVGSSWDVDTRCVTLIVVIRRRRRPSSHLWRLQPLRHVAVGHSARNPEAEIMAVPSTIVLLRRSLTSDFATSPAPRDHRSLCVTTSRRVTKHARSRG